MEDLTSIMLNLVSSFADISVEEVHEDDSLSDDLGLDSLSILEFSSEVEDYFKIEIPFEEAIQLDTIRHYVAFLDSVELP